MSEDIWQPVEVRLADVKALAWSLGYSNLLDPVREVLAVVEKLIADAKETVPDYA